MKLDLQRLGNVDKKLNKIFVNASPYPHIIIDDFLSIEDANKLLYEHSEETSQKIWGSYVHFNEKKVV